MSRSSRWRQSPRRRKIAAGHVVYFHAFSHFAHPFRRNGRPFHSFTSLAYNCSCPPPQKKALPSHTRWCKMILWVCFTLGNIFGFRAESRSEGTRDPLLFAPGARALTPDQQDGVGEKTCCCRRTCFFKLYADKLEKRRFTQNVQPQKNCGLLWHYR